jgi:hypothetical protein
VDPNNGGTSELIQSENDSGATDVFYAALMKFLIGDDGMTEYGWRTNKTRGKVHTESVAERKLSDSLTRLFRIYFPTWETVASSKGGIGVSFT